MYELSFIITGIKDISDNLFPFNINKSFGLDYEAPLTSMKIQPIMVKKTQCVAFDEPPQNNTLLFNSHTLLETHSLLATNS